MIKTVYAYDRFTGEYRGETLAYKHPVDDTYPLPAYSCYEEPPSTGEEEVAVYEGGEWVVKCDLRGVVYYDVEGVKYTIVNIGEELPEDALLTPPVKPLTQEEILLQRELAYKNESDKHFMEAYRKRLIGDEEGALLAEQEGLRVVEDIKLRFPLQ